MADASTYVRVVETHVTELPNPTNMTEVGKAYSMSAHEFEEYHGRQPTYDDDILVIADEDSIRLEWRKKEGPSHA